MEEEGWYWNEASGAWSWGDGDDGCGVWREANGDWCALVVVGGEAVTFGPFSGPTKARRDALSYYRREVEHE